MDDGTARHALREYDISPEESLRLLAGVRLGRVAFSRNALPTIRPVNHAVADGFVIIRANLGSALTSSERQVVAFVADAIDQETHSGWWVIVTGFAEEIVDRELRDRYLAVLPSLLPGPRDQVVAIRPDIVTGVRLADPDDATAGCEEPPPR